ncbi:MAG: hypothetical protein QXV17_14875 [Candidatus Micrarchaeaceae archaeon]
MDDNTIDDIENEIAKHKIKLNPVNLQSYKNPNKKRYKKNEDLAIQIIYNMLNKDILMHPSIIYKEIKKQNISLSGNYIYAVIKKMRVDLLYGDFSKEKSSNKEVLEKTLEEDLDK